MARVLEDNGPLMFPADGAPYRSGWRPVRLSPSGQAACRQLADQVEDALRPAPRELIITHLTRLAAHYWSDRSEGQWKVVFADYAEDLADVPGDILLAGLAAYRRKGRWWPKVSELLDEMRAPLGVRHEQVRRLRILGGQSPTVDHVRRDGEFRALGACIQASGAQARPET